MSVDMCVFFVGNRISKTAKLAIEDHKIRNLLFKPIKTQKAETTVLQKD